MEERRRSKRTEMSSTLMVKRLDQGDMQEVSIDIVDGQRDPQDYAL